jgi:glyoxylase-like metal-dependent hydrolase (beta-lactamase superfamily II)
MCLYEPVRKFLISGDLILANISSNITARFDVADALGNYLESLERVYKMDIKLVLPGHRAIIMTTVNGLTN